ncbi:MAG: hypothetical protein JWP65_895 [Ramlibacter sp.]|jgi:uncharacterized membrane protein|uniref:DUF2243 domain-containing protein n=1 Tax=Ramlibacter sp. TaxID=1917967 RepID=UPI00260237F7|nr:DUF2243 domain-containing protein [Ramlibacter sp.]MDB5750474.1 hypothetical protein [Ramlibacter sp.]
MHGPSSFTVANRPMRWGAFLVGIALGGFFDGILLHQVLQWHHFLSNVQAAALQDIRMQLLADGLFHVLMYVVAMVGLYQLWRAREQCAQPGSKTLLWGSALLGFCIWHFIDIVVAHWIVGIHRVRVDSPNPLLWDLLWVAIFGVLPLIFGWRMVRRGPGSGGGGGGGQAAASLGIVALLAGPMAAWPAAQTDQVMVVFTPGTSSTAAFNALASVDARVLWVDRSGGLWAVQMAQPRLARSLYRRGALLVSNSPVALGCLTWTRART